jgi:hypothetical protein
MLIFAEYGYAREKNKTKQNKTKITEVIMINIWNEKKNTHTNKY